MATRTSEKTKDLYLKHGSALIHDVGVRDKNLVEGTWKIKRCTHILKCAKPRHKNVMDHIFASKPKQKQFFDWVNSQRHVFRGDVYGPIVSEITVHDDMHALFLNNTIHPNILLYGFVYTDDTDHQMLLRQAKTMNVRCKLFSSKWSAQQCIRRPVDHETLHCHGVNGYLDEVFEARDIIKRTLNHLLCLHQRAYARDDLDEQSLDRILVMRPKQTNRLHYLITPNARYSVRENIRYMRRIEHHQHPILCKARACTVNVKMEEIEDQPTNNTQGKRKYKDVTNASNTAPLQMPPHKKHKSNAKGQRQMIQNDSGNQASAACTENAANTKRIPLYDIDLTRESDNSDDAVDEGVQSDIHPIQTDIKQHASSTRKRVARKTRHCNQRRNDKVLKAPSKPPKPSKLPKLNSYYSTKRRQAMQAQQRFERMSTKKDGKIIIRLPINTVCSEYKSNTVFVTHFGTIPDNASKADKYCDKSYIYPIGFRAYRVHLSYKDPRQKTKYFMRICDNGMKGPLFEIYAEDDPTHVIQHKSLTTPWQTIIENISKRAKEVKCDGQRESNGTSGPRWLGLRDYLIMGIIELLPNTQKCTAYWRSKAKQNLPY
eukprot:1037302_1